MLVLLNAYYLAYYFYHQWKLAEQKADRNKGELPNKGKSSRETFLVQRGAESIPLPVEAIAYFYHDGDYNYLATFEAERYLVSQSLDEVEAQLDELVFFRANRQFIVQRKACSHFSTLDFGKLELFVAPLTKEPIVISQRRAKNFKEWMNR